MTDASNLTESIAVCAVPVDAEGSTMVIQHRWGQDLEALKPPFDVIVACGNLPGHSVAALSYFSVGMHHLACLYAACLSVCACGELTFMAGTLPR